MTTLAPEPALSASLADLAALRSQTPIIRLLSSIASIGSVTRIAISFESTNADAWVLMDNEVLEDAERIFLLEREFRQTAGAFPLEVHVIPLSEVDARHLPPAETIFAR